MSSRHRTAGRRALVWLRHGRPDPRIRAAPSGRRVAARILAANIALAACSSVGTTGDANPGTDGAARRITDTIDTIDTGSPESTDERGHGTTDPGSHAASVPATTARCVPATNETGTGTPIIERTYTVDGTLVAAPYNVSTPVLMHDRKLWHTARLDPDDPPATLDELESVLRSSDPDTNAADVVVALALESGSRDNVTAVVVSAQVVTRASSQEGVGGFEETQPRGEVIS